MKLLVWLVGASILLNIYVFWRLHEPSRVRPTRFHAPEITQQATSPFEIEKAPEENEIEPLKMQIAALVARLEAMEERNAVAGVESEKPLDMQEQYTGTKEVFDSFNHASTSAADEEWFWSEDADEEAPLSFGQTDGFTVHSVVCRSDWCRVELENTSGGGQDLISDLELQLRINESLGRDTVIRAGERNGRHRVLFVQ